MTVATEYLDMAGIAELLGVKHQSVHVYHTRAKRNRTAGTPRPGDLPEPDERFGNTPVWHVDTIERWRTQQRPGQGAGGGRPWGKEKGSESA